MKSTLLTIKTIVIILFSFSLQAQLDESAIRDKVLLDVKEETEKRARELESRIFDLDQEIQKIDEVLKQSESSEEIIAQLKSRVEKLEAIQVAQKQQELNIYDNNFQSAVINLVSMERELKPLILFNSSREFFGSLSDVSNPMNYNGYKEWFAVFKKYLETNRSSDVMLDITAKLIDNSGDTSKGLSIVGPLSEALFISINKFIQSFGKKKKDLREKSVLMFELTMTLGQYTNDRNLIETGWISINKELEELQILQESTLAEIFNILSIKKDDFNKKYIEETDALKRIDYLKSIQDIIKNMVKQEQSINNDGWRDKIYYQMTTVQSLKIRFGNITFKIKENIAKHKDLIAKYNDNKLIGGKIKILEEKLNNLSSAFDDAFNPQKYINDAVRMYKNN